MPKHDEIRVLPYSAEQLFLLVADIGRYPEFLPWCKAARIVEASEQRVRADLIVGTKMFQEKFTSLVTLNRPSLITVDYVSGPLAHLTNQWHVKSQSADSCELSFHVDFDFRSTLLRSAMEMFFDKALLKMMTAFEARAKELYQNGSSDSGGRAIKRT